MRLPEMRIPEWDKSQLPFLNNYFDKVRKMFYNKIEFADNMYVDFVTFTSSGGAGTPHLISHGLNRTPQGYIVTASNSGTTYCSGAGWDSDNICLTLVSSGLTAGGAPGVDDVVTVMVF